MWPRSGRYRRLFLQKGPCRPRRCRSSRLQAEQSQPSKVATTNFEFLLVLVLGRFLVIFGVILLGVILFRALLVGVLVLVVFHLLGGRFRLGFRFFFGGGFVPFLLGFALVL